MLLFFGGTDAYRINKKVLELGDLFEEGIYKIDKPDIYKVKLFLSRSRQMTGDTTKLYVMEHPIEPKAVLELFKNKKSNKNKYKAIIIFPPDFDLEANNTYNVKSETINILETNNQAINYVRELLYSYDSTNPDNNCLSLFVDRTGLDSITLDYEIRRLLLLGVRFDNLESLISNISYRKQVNIYQVMELMLNPHERQLALAHLFLYEQQGQSLADLRQLTVAFLAEVITLKTAYKNKQASHTLKFNFNKWRLGEVLKQNPSLDLLNRKFNKIAVCPEAQLRSCLVAMIEMK